MSAASLIGFRKTSGFSFIPQVWYLILNSSRLKCDGVYTFNFQFGISSKMCLTGNEASMKAHIKLSEKYLKLGHLYWEANHWLVSEVQDYTL